jgi:hypothetical protein
MNFVFNISSNCNIVNHFYNGGQPPSGGNEQPVPGTQPSENVGNGGLKTNFSAENAGEIGNRARNEAGTETPIENNSLVDENGFMTVPPYHDLKPTVMPVIDPDIIPKPTSRRTRFAYMRGIPDSPSHHFPSREAIEAELEKEGATSVIINENGEAEAEFEPMITYADGRQEVVDLETLTNPNVEPKEETTVEQSTKKRERKPRVKDGSKSEIKTELKTLVESINQTEPIIQTEPVAQTETTA